MEATAGNFDSSISRESKCTMVCRVAQGMMWMKRLGLS